MGCICTYPRHQGPSTVLQGRRLLAICGNGPNIRRLSEIDTIRSAPCRVVCASPHGIMRLGSWTISCLQSDQKVSRGLSVTDALVGPTRRIWHRYILIVQVMVCYVKHSYVHTCLRSQLKSLADLSKGHTVTTVSRDTNGIVGTCLRRHPSPSFVTRFRRHL